jgi:HAD superfamily hydrolase (TIGR01450 family)
MLWDKYDSVILDLDGVVYIGDYAVEHAIESLNDLPDDVVVTAATNNASRTSEVVGIHLRELGLQIDDEDVVTSAQAGAQLLSRLVPADARVLAVGGEGVAQALIDVGLHPLRATRDHAANHTIAMEIAGVLQGHGFDTSWWDLATASWSISRGAQWIATNRDLTVPTPFGLGPGNGSLVSAIQEVTGVAPLVAGKPEPTLFNETKLRKNLQSPLVIGDRLDTDIDGAIAAGMDSMLVLTGIHQIGDVLKRDPESRPTYVVEDLRALLGHLPSTLPVEIG